MTAASPKLRLLALILAPAGRDSTVASSLIGQAGVDSEACRDLPELVARLGDRTAFVLVTEEAIRDGDLRTLAGWVAAQPAWSDLPFIVVTDQGGGLERNPAAGRVVEVLGNVSFIERPFHPTTLLSLVGATAKSRQRQIEVRDLLETLGESQARLRTALKAGRLTAWEFEFGDQSYIVSDDEPGASGGGSAFDVIGFFGRIHPDDRARVTAAIQHSLSTGDDYAVEFRNLESDGGVHWLDVRAHLLRDAAGRPLRLVGLSSEITARKTAEGALQQMNDELERRVAERTRQLQRAHDELMAQIAERARTEDQLRHVQKIESIGELTGGVAHDFNNLLTAVLGNLELLRKRVPADPSTDRLIDGAMQGAQRGAALTQRLLAFARRQALEPKAVDLAGLVRGMTDLLRRSIGPAIEIDIDVPAGLPAALADANQIELALLNLAVNARDAMPQGGIVSIALALADSAATRDLAAGRYLRLSVADSGVGMDAATLQRAIEPFFSTKEVGKGTGLGLSMIHGLAQQLSGALRLHSEPGKGTRAELWLPVAGGEAVAAPPELPPAERSARRGATLLFVEDDFLIRLSTASLLEDLGHTVIKAGSGAEALEFLRAGHKVDLMITDYAMPGMTGLQLAEAVRALRPGLPILLATGYADLPARSALDLPRLSKPYHQRELAQQISSLLA